MRATSFRFLLTPLIVAGTVAFFLLLMVGLGLIGVLWQNLLQRTREIGLRRAAGASRAAVHRQVLLEQIVVTSLGVLIGTLLVIQIPVLDLIGVLVATGCFASGLLVAMVGDVSALRRSAPSTPARWRPGCSRPRRCGTNDRMILIVDDDPSVTASLSLLLKRHGHPARAARSPEEALALLREQEFDLVLQDMNFSRATTGEEGLELLAAIRRLRPRLPVILITAWGSIAPGGRGDEGGRGGLRHQAVVERPAPAGGGDRARRWPGRGMRQGGAGEPRGARPARSTSAA